jgi:hypothetical protein
VSGQPSQDCRGASDIGSVVRDNATISCRTRHMTAAIPLQPRQCPRPFAPRPVFEACATRAVAGCPTRTCGPTATCRRWSATQPPTERAETPEQAAQRLRRQAERTLIVLRNRPETADPKQGTRRGGRSPLPSPVRVHP